MKNAITVQFVVVLLALTTVLALGCNQTGPRTDAQVASDVHRQIADDATVENKELSVHAQNGVVTLSGNVSSDAERIAAANDAATVEGVKTVMNDVQVRRPKVGRVSDRPAGSRATRHSAENGSYPAPQTSRNQRSSPGTNLSTILTAVFGVTQLGVIVVVVWCLRKLLRRSRRESGSNKAVSNSRQCSSPGATTSIPTQPPASLEPDIPTELLARANDDPEAMFQVGEIFEAAYDASSGHDRLSSIRQGSLIDKAIWWYEKAGSKNHIKACRAVAELYWAKADAARDFFGNRGVEERYWWPAYQWMKKALELGDDDECCAGRVEHTLEMFREADRKKDEYLALHDFDYPPVNLPPALGQEPAQPKSPPKGKQLLNL